jgi:D-galactose 1-dehydrogenase
LSFPQNRQTPIAAELRFADLSDAPIEVSLDFLHPGEPRWDIEVDTGGSTLRLIQGGGRMSIDGRQVDLNDGASLLGGEYPALYRRFAELIRTGVSETDVAPLRHVADAFMLAERRTVGPFQF